MFADLIIRVQNIQAMESEAVRMMEGSNTDHILATMDFLSDCRKVRESIYAMPAWKAGK